MIRSLLRLAAVSLLLVPGALSAAAPPGLQYDELVRVVIGATPPPPGNFAADVAALNAPVAAATPAPKKKGLGGLGNIAGAVLTGQNVGNAVAGAVVSNAIDAQMDRMLTATAGTFANALRGLTQGRLERHAYYNGWERIDDVAAQTATIRKCDIHQVVKLDIAKKTYQVFDPTSEPVDKPGPAPAPQPRNRQSATPAPEAPGTAVIDFSQNVKPLGAARLEGIDTTGYDDRTTLGVTQATGSCRNGTFGFDTRAYYSKIAQPNVSCPVTAARQRYPDQPVTMVASGGCRPTFTAHKSGPVPPAGSLAMYAAMQFLASDSGSAATPAPSATPGGFTFLTERGNVHSLSGADAALFEIPKDFTRVP
ncbi:MAG: hypothetical protein ABR591_04200 [Candidatus Velthaea sp.]